MRPLRRLGIGNGGNDVSAQRPGLFVAPLAIENRRLQQAQLDGLGLARPVELRLGALKQRVGLAHLVETYQTDGGVVLSIHGRVDVVPLVGEIRRLTVQRRGLAITTKLKSDAGDPIGALETVIRLGLLLGGLAGRATNETQDQQ